MCSSNVWATRQWIRDRGWLTSAAALLGLTVVLGCEEPERHYVRAEYQGQAVRWAAKDIALYVHAPSDRSAITHAALLAATRNAVRAWTEECSGMHIEVRSSRQRASIARDGINAVALREDSWCPQRRDTRGDCYEPRLEALTHVYKGMVGNEALIGEADIEVNAVDHSLSPEALEALLVHEVGHLLGLRHACTTALFALREDSSLKQCDAELQLTMHPDPKTRRGMRAPAAGERRFVCDVYGHK